MNHRRRTTLGALFAAVLGPLLGRRVRAALPAGEPDPTAFQQRSVAAALQRLGLGELADSAAIDLDVPDIAENGAVVPVAVRSRIPGTDAILVLLEKNPFPLAAFYDVADGIAPGFSMRVKMAETADVIAVVRAGSRCFQTRREVKVTIGGCGG